MSSGIPTIGDSQQIDKISGSLVAWRKGSAADEVNRLNIAAGETREEDGLSWTHGNIQQHRYLKAAGLRKLLGIIPETAMTGPKDTLVTVTGERRKIAVAWMQQNEETLDDAVKAKWGKQKGTITPIGNNAVLLENITPFRSNPLPMDSYYPKKDPQVNADRAAEEYKLCFDTIDSFGLKPGADENLQRFFELRDFYKFHVGWGKMDNMGTVRSDQNLSNKKAFITMLPQGNDQLQKMMGAFALHVPSPGNPLPWLSFTPYDVSRQWKTVLGLHELYHLKDAVDGKLPKPGDRNGYMDMEVRAFSINAAALQIQSKLQFYGYLDDLMEHHGIQSFDQLAACRGGRKNLMMSIARDLDTLLHFETPRGSTEADVRITAYHNSLAFRAADRGMREVGTTTVDETKREWIARLYQQVFDGQPNPKT